MNRLLLFQSCMHDSRTWEIYQLSRRTPQQTSRLPKTSAEDSRSWNRPMIQCQLWSPDITGSHWLFPGIDGNNQSGDWIISTVGFFSRFLGTSSNICHEVVGSSMFLPCGTNTAYYHLLSHQNQKKTGIISDRWEATTASCPWTPAIPTWPGWPVVPIFAPTTSPTSPISSCEGNMKHPPESPSWT